MSAVRTTFFIVKSKTQLSTYLRSALLWLLRGWDDIQGSERRSRADIDEGPDFDSAAMIVTTITLITPRPLDPDLISAIRCLIIGSCPRAGEVSVSQPMTTPPPTVFVHE